MQKIKMSRAQMKKRYTEMYIMLQDVMNENKKLRAELNQIRGNVDPTVLIQPPTPGQIMAVGMQKRGR